MSLNNKQVTLPTGNHRTLPPKDKE